jgi:hypothetical protein
MLLGTEIGKATQKQTALEKINEAVATESKPLIDKHNQEKNPEKRLKLQYEIYQIVSRVSLRKIYELSDQEFERYLKQIAKPFADAYEKFEREVLVQRITQGAITPADLALIAAEQEIIARTFGKPLSSSLDQLYSRRKMLERMLILMIMQLAQTGLQLQMLSAWLEPFSELANTASSRFGAGPDWLFAVSILATHENLVKKKLVDLGIDEKLFEKARFSDLVDRLASEIEIKEGRKLGLSFLKTASLRDTRNEMEHRGYRHKVTRQQMLELLKDLRDFEKEVYATNGSKVTRPSI